jgi:hypothetical protein
VIAFTTRLIGTLVAVWAVIVAGSPLSTQASDSSWVFANLAPRVNIYLLIAAGIRLGIPPFNSQYLPETAMGRGKLTLLNLALPAATLPIIVRVSLTQQPLIYNEILLLWIGLAALLSSLSWITSADEAEARPYWAPAIAALALACGIHGEAAASLAWGVSLMLSGGLIFLYSIRRRWLLPLLVLGAIGISALPFTPTWSTVRLFTVPVQPLSLVFMASQALILGGYLHYALRTTAQPTKGERWIWVIYPLGLAILPSVQWLILWWSQNSSLIILPAAPSWVESWPGFIVAGLSILYALWRLRGHKEPARLGSTLHRLVALEWLYRPLWRGYELLSRTFALFNRVLEGRAGILWALLILILLVSVFAQGRPGG